MKALMFVLLFFTSLPSTVLNASDSPDFNDLYQVYYSQGFNTGASRGYAAGYNGLTYNSTPINSFETGIYKEAYDNGYRTGYEQYYYSGIQGRETGSGSNRPPNKPFPFEGN
ncbi:hypothetical protein [Desertivirga brevis]|uniref:hypothetical protein n=1 Tax=Desertivirga brevis TaxID=2810310 RepID=UPI001A976512|nr:hypothetical protein [Pedobacter sp. SYSU D00873]